MSGRHSVGGACDLAVIGSHAEGGEATLELLEACDWVGELHLVDDASGAGKRIRFGNRHLVVGEVDAFDFSRVRIALFTGDRVTALAHAPRAAAAGCMVVDVTGAFSEDSAVPLVVPELNPAALARVGGGAIVAGPTGAAVPLARVLQPLHAAHPIRRVHATVCVPASEMGVAGVGELATQTNALLGGQPAKASLFSEQVAFNIQRAAAGAATPQGSNPEAVLVRAMERLFDGEGPEVEVALLQVPVFFGFTIHLALDVDPACDAQRATELLMTAPGVELHQDGRDPTVVGDAAGSSLVHLGQVRDGHAAGSLALWAVADNVCCCRADNGVRIASLLVREHLGSSVKL